MWGAMKIEADILCNIYVYHSKWYWISQGTKLDVMQCYVLETVLWYKK